jgi:hypothetical protein
MALDPEKFFAKPHSATHRQYEALRAFFYDGKQAEEVARRFGYKLSAFYSLTRDFRHECTAREVEEKFFVSPTPGRRPEVRIANSRDLILTLRKKYLSVSDIKAVLDSQTLQISEQQIYRIIQGDGFARLPRRTKRLRDETLAMATIAAPQSKLLACDPEIFQTQHSIGVLCFLPYLQQYGIDKLIQNSGYPATTTIPRLNSILSFLALKLSGAGRYTMDDQWCMDRGLGVFAGLNVLPKAAWFTSYSHRVTREMNLKLLKKVHTVWGKHGLLSDTANLDFVSIPYWGDDAHLENNWSGTRHKAMPSLLAALAQDPQSGIVTYGDTNVRHKNKSGVVVEFLDFYKEDHTTALKYLVFDSKFTTYENLRKLDDAEVKFLTIRRRGEKIIRQLNALPPSAWTSLRVPDSTGKGRTLSTNDQTIHLAEYDKQIRQIAITGHGKIKPALIITNDFNIKVADVVRKYAQRWLVEQDIAEQIYFFHLNRVSSSMVIKVDFDLTMSILAHNLYRLLAADLPGYSQATAQSLFNRFILNSGQVRIDNSSVTVLLRKKRHLPAILTAMRKFQDLKISFLNNTIFRFAGASHS